MKLKLNIMIPIDSIEWDNTLNAVESVIEFASGCELEEGTEVILMHVLHSESGDHKISGEEKVDLEKKRISQEFETVEEMCRKEGVENVRTVIKRGDPKKERAISTEIIETAKEVDADVIAMGSGKLHNGSFTGKINKFLYGSVTERVLHEAHCSVLVSRPMP